MKLKFGLIAGAVMALSMLSGCYTVIQHPDITTTDKNGYSYSQQVNFYDDCKSCHSNTDNHKYVKTTKGVTPVKTYHDTNETDNGEYVNSDGFGEYGYYDDYYTPYYTEQYYGNYGNYYSRPWWYDVAPPAPASASSKAVEDYRRSNARNNDGGRNEGGRSEGYSHSGGGTTISSPTAVTTGSGGSTSSGASGSSGSSSSSSTSSSSGSDNRSSSSSSGSNSRNNDGQRSTNSGRR